MLVAVSLRYPVVFTYICINIDFTIFFSKNKWNNSLSHIWKHKNRHIIYVFSVCSFKIIRKYVYFYIRWIFMIFWAGIKWKINLTDKMHESVIWDIWAYTSMHDSWSINFCFLILHIAITCYLEICCDILITIYRPNQAINYWGH